MTARSISDRPSKLLAEWFWIDRWTGSSAFLLPLEARGLYREMLTQAWRRGGSLPNEPEAICRAVGCTAAEWRRCWPKVERFWRVDGENLINDTQAEVYAARLAAIEQSSSKARKGAQARWGHNPSNTQASPEHKPEQCDLDPDLDPRQEIHSQRSASAFPARAPAIQTSGVMAGTLPRDHLNCKQPCIRVCISEKQHAILRERHGGTDADLEAFYREVRANLNGPVGQRPWEFWESQFIAKFGGNVDKRTAGNAAAKERFLARGAK